ncbi:MAG: hypothetical protein NVSMB6_03410 [Burkholderiaceae bacterium]
MLRKSHQIRLRPVEASKCNPVLPTRGHDQQLRLQSDAKVPHTSRRLARNRGHSAVVTACCARRPRLGAAALENLLQGTYRKSLPRALAQRRGMRYDYPNIMRVRHGQTDCFWTSW